MALTIVKYPAKVLSSPARKIKPEDGIDLHKLFEEMKVVMKDDDGIGLAAPQIGLGIRFLIAHDTKAGVTTGYVNPQIIEFSEEREVASEGCLSFPGLYGYVERSLAIRIKYQDLDFNPHEDYVEGWYARVLQHEIDHINGICIINRAIDGLHEPPEDEEDEDVDGDSTETDGERAGTSHRRLD